MLTWTPSTACSSEVCGAGGMGSLGGTGWPLNGVNQNGGWSIARRDASACNLTETSCKPHCCRALSLCPTAHPKDAEALVAQVCGVRRGTGHSTWLGLPCSHQRALMHCWPARGGTAAPMPSFCLPCTMCIGRPAPTMPSSPMPPPPARWRRCGRCTSSCTAEAASLLSPPTHACCPTRG